MATVTYKSLTALQPVDLNYNFYKTESLQKDVESFVEGYTLYNYSGLKNFQDISINKNTCFILTNNISLSTFFQPQTKLSIKEIASTVNLQPRNSSIYYIGYDAERDIVTQQLTPQNIFITSINDKEIEIRIGSLYLEVEKEYPYTVRCSDLPLPQDELYRRRFYWIYQDNSISFITETKEGFRYLALGQDNVLRATGVIIGTRVINDYIFNIAKVTDVELDYNFELKNNWFTYYLDFASQKENNTLTVNKKFNAPINYLISFPIQPNNIQNVNIANLKTGFTPTGNPAPTDNSYNEEIVTTN